MLTAEVMQQHSRVNHIQNELQMALQQQQQQQQMSQFAACCGDDGLTNPAALSTMPLSAFVQQMNAMDQQRLSGAAPGLASLFAIRQNAMDLAARARQPQQNQATVPGPRQSWTPRARFNHNNTNNTSGDSAQTSFGFPSAPKE